MRALNSIGLLLDIIGLLLVSRYGLPSRMAWRGAQLLAVGPASTEVKERAKVWDRISRRALQLIVIGFGLQLVSTLFGG